MRSPSQPVFLRLSAAAWKPGTFASSPFRKGGLLGFLRVSVLIVTHPEPQTWTQGPGPQTWTQNFQIAPSRQSPKSSAQASLLSSPLGPSLLLGAILLQQTDSSRLCVCTFQGCTTPGTSPPSSNPTVLCLLQSCPCESPQICLS